MLEKKLTVGAPCPLPRSEAGQRGAGTLCSHGVVTNILDNRHKYLPFCPNGINWVAQDGQDIVSYNFSGCIMAAFTYQGVKRVCHVSTGAGQDCLAEWDRIKKASTNVFEFRPHEFIDTGDEVLGGCYGLITSDLQTYSITISALGGKKLPNGNYMPATAGQYAAKSLPTVLSVKKARLMR